MNRLVNKTERYTWSERCKELLGKYVEFYTTNKNYIRGFVGVADNDDRHGPKMIIYNRNNAPIYSIGPDDLLTIEEQSVLEGMRIFKLDNAYDIGDLKSLIFKTMDELKPFDLLCRGFSGKYKLSVGAIYDIKNILDKEKLSE